MARSIWPRSWSGMARAGPAFLSQALVNCKILLSLRYTGRRLDQDRREVLLNHLIAAQFSLFLACDRDKANYAGAVLKDQPRSLGIHHRSDQMAI